MKKSRTIIPSIIMIIYLILTFLPQTTILGGKELFNDILLKMFIAIIIISIYFVARFYKKGIAKILINTFAIPTALELIVLLLGVFFGKVIYGNPIVPVLFVIVYIIYFTIYIKELE